MTTLPEDIKQLVKEEVEASYSEDEISAFKSFKEFWEAIEVLNAYEEEWSEYLSNGVKAIYIAVFYELTTHSIEDDELSEEENFQRAKDKHDEAIYRKGVDNHED